MLEDPKVESKFRVELTLEQVKTLALALEAAGRLNIGQVDIAHEYAAPHSNRAAMCHTDSEVYRTKMLFKGLRDPRDNELHRKFEELMYNFRGFYHNYLADQKEMPKCHRTSFVIYDGPEVLGYQKLKIEEVIDS